MTASSVFWEGLDSTAQARETGLSFDPGKPWRLGVGLLAWGTLGLYAWRTYVYECNSSRGIMATRRRELPPVITRSRVVIDFFWAGLSALSRQVNLTRIQTQISSTFSAKKTS